MRHLATTALLLAVAGAAGAAPAELADDTARVNYSVGFQIGGDFQRQGVELDAAAMLRGIEDALGGRQPAIDADEMRATLTGLKRRIVAEQQRRRGEAAEQKRVAGREFLARNATRDGVMTTASGLQYRIIEPGTGKSPTATDTVTVHYRGTLTDGKEFDSSHKHGKPASFRLDGVIKGWSEGLQLLREGGKAELYIPPELAYGDRGPLGDQTLVFEVELIAVEATTTPQP